MTLFKDPLKQSIMHTFGKILRDRAYFAVFFMRQGIECGEICHIPTSLLSTLSPSPGRYSSFKTSRSYTQSLSSFSMQEQTMTSSVQNHREFATFLTLRGMFDGPGDWQLALPHLSIPRIQLEAFLLRRKLSLSKSSPIDVDGSYTSPELLLPCVCHTKRNLLIGSHKESGAYSIRFQANNSPNVEFTFKRKLKVCPKH